MKRRSKPHVKAQVKSRQKQSRKKPVDIIEIFEERYKSEYGIGTEQEAAFRKHNNLKVVNAWFEDAFKRWQAKLRKDGVIQAPNGLKSTAPDDQHPWVLTIGSSHHSCVTTFSVGAAPVLGDVNKEDWNLRSYNSTYFHAQPVVIYGSHPIHLWPGDVADNYRDCALLIAAGVRFSVYHSSMPHPDHPEYDIGRQFTGSGEKWAGYDHFGSVYTAARNERELLLGIVAITERILNHVRNIEEKKKEILKKERDLMSQQIATLTTSCLSVPQVFSSLV